MVEVAGHRDDQVARPVVVVEEASGSRRWSSASTLGGVPEHLAAEGVVGEHRRRALLRRVVGGLVGVHQDLVEDDLALGVDVVDAAAPARVMMSPEDVEPEREVARPGAGCRTPCTPWW